MRDDGSRRPRQPAFTRGELTLMALGVACVVGQVIVYRGPDSSTTARVAVVVLGVVTFGSFFIMAGLVVRRGRARRRGSP